MAFINDPQQFPVWLRQNLGQRFQRRETDFWLVGLAAAFASRDLESAFAKFVMGGDTDLGLLSHRFAP
jgi:hypothetical protein